VTAEEKLDRAHGHPSLISFRVMDSGEVIRRALATVEEIRAAYESGSAGYFDLFTEGASVFPLAARLRLQGREAYRRFATASFRGEGPRAVHVLNPEVLPLGPAGDAALVTYHQRTRSAYQSSDSRVTLLLVPEGGRLRIAHLHMSPLASAGEDDARGLVEEVIGLAPPETSE
jgi:ketosteroid isomerase-like protein